MAHLHGDTPAVDMAGWLALAQEVDPTVNIEARQAMPLAGSGETAEEEAIRVRALQLLMLLDQQGDGSMSYEELLTVHGGDARGLLDLLPHSQASPSPYPKEHVQALPPIPGPPLTSPCP